MAKKKKWWAIVQLTERACGPGGLRVFPSSNEPMTKKEAIAEAKSRINEGACLVAIAKTKMLAKLPIEIQAV